MCVLRHYVLCIFVCVGFVNRTVNADGGRGHGGAP